MKMSKDLFTSLKADVTTVCEGRPESVATPADAWSVFKKVWMDRSYDDDHPGFRDGHWVRVLPYSGRNHLDRFYGDEDLNDDHIATALRQIMPNAWAKAKASA